MRIEHFVKFPDMPGLEEVYTIMPEEAKCNPRCPCQARTCPNHGFCQYCVAHHEDIDCIRVSLGREPHNGPVCRRG